MGSGRKINEGRKTENDGLVIILDRKVREDVSEKRIRDLDYMRKSQACVRC